MRRAVLATASTSALVVSLLLLKPHQSGAPQTPSPSPRGNGTPAAPAHRTGTFAGDPVDTRYGTVRVAAVVNQGRLTAVKVLETPSANGRDRQIAADAVPRLTREALAAQSAHIDAVSGASYTSEGYVRSLQSALDRAGA
ncbi:FMN-binding protein [Streptomyces meridianus]|uniref:FMN-binding protein n=1 Tax=Streptomyces meridianus TaxID=2938945 RepID=A0ABT0XA45_9ACTN|nr:FMN-binding protein [Streptomyces meridianus]MCM2579165.1 FMN-binding protein [Streptomyces meridianus]